MPEDVSDGAVGLGAGAVEFAESVGVVAEPVSEEPPELEPDPVEGAGVMVSPDPVSQTRPLGSVAMPLVIVVPLDKRKVPLL